MKTMGVAIFVIADSVFAGVTVAAAMDRHWFYAALGAAGLAFMGCVALVAAGDR